MWGDLEDIRGKGGVVGIHSFVYIYNTASYNLKVSLDNKAY